MEQNIPCYQVAEKLLFNKNNTSSSSSNDNGNNGNCFINCKSVDISTVISLEKQQQQQQQLLTEQQEQKQQFSLLLTAVAAEQEQQKQQLLPLLSQQQLLEQKQFLEQQQQKQQQLLMQQEDSVRDQMYRVFLNKKKKQQGQQQQQTQQQQQSLSKSNQPSLQQILYQQDAYQQLAKEFGSYIELAIRKFLCRAGFQIEECSRVYCDRFSSKPDGLLLQPFCNCQNNSLLHFCCVPLEIKASYFPVKEETIDCVYSEKNMMQMLSHLFHYKAHLCLYFHYFRETGNHLLSLVIDDDHSVWKKVITAQLMTEQRERLKRTNILPIYHYDREKEECRFFENNEWKSRVIKQYQDASLWEKVTSWLGGEND